MSPLDFIKKEKTATNTVSVLDAIKSNQKKGTLNKPASDFTVFNEPSKLESRVETKPADLDFFERTSDNFRALKNQEFSFKDVVKQIPKTALRQGIAVSNFVAPAISKFVDTTGSIFGEGLAYAFDKNVREQYRAGNLDILPTITEITTPKLAKYTIAAGLETAIFRSIPEVARAKLGKFGLSGVGALEGIGFAISEGLAKDETPEEILKKMPLYGVTGGVLGILTPYLIPLLKSEVKYLPKEFKKMITGLEETIPETPSRMLDVQTAGSSRTAVPVSTPKSRYAEYLRKMGYEPYTPESELPTIQRDIKVNKNRDLPHVPEGMKEPIINADKLEAPKVASPKTKAQIEEDYLRSKGYEPYTPENELPVIKLDKEIPETINDELPVIDFDGGKPAELGKIPGTRYVADNPVKPTNTKTSQTPTKKTPKEKVDERDIEYAYDVSYPNKAKADITEFEPKRVTVTDETGVSKTYVKKAETPKVEASDAPAIKVPSRQLPVVGEGVTKMSKLESRIVRDVSDPTNPKPLDPEKAATYQAVTKKEQMSKAAKYVEENSDDALAVLRGEKDAPEGLLDNSIALALAKKAELEGDSALAIRLASLRSTRAGQEISMLTEADPLGIVSQIEDIVRARKSRSGRAVKGTGRKETVGAAEKQATQIKKQATVAVDAARLKIEDAEKLLNDILC